MWTNLLKSGLAPSLLICKNPQDDPRIGSSIMLDLCVDLVRRVHHDQILWIRPDGYKHAPSPDLVEASDFSEYLMGARNIADGSGPTSHLDLIACLKSISIKYVHDFQHLRAIAGNLHLMRPIPIAVVLEDADRICGSPDKFIEIVALFSEAIYSHSHGGKSSFLGSCITISSRGQSTRQLSTFFEQRVDFCAVEQGEACKLKSVSHSGTPEEFASMVIVRRKTGEQLNKNHKVNEPLLIWMAEVT